VQEWLYVFLVVEIVSVDRDVLDFIAGVYGGKVYPKRKVGAWKWVAYSNVAYNFLLNVYRYLQIKRRQADLAMMFQERMIKGNNYISDDEMKWREWVRKEISVLKKMYDVFDFAEFDTDEEARQYIAGLFDAEGYVGVSERNRGSMYLRVEIGNRCLKLLEWLKSIYGGSIYWSRRAYVFELVSFGAKRLLDDVLPYLHVKKERAKIALEYQSITKKGRQDYAILKRRKKLARLLKELNY